MQCIEEIDVYIQKNRLPKQAVLSKKIINKTVFVGCKEPASFKKMAMRIRHLSNLKVPFEFKLESY